MSARRDKHERKLIEDVNSLQEAELVEHIFPNGELDLARISIRNRSQVGLELKFLTSSALANNKILLEQCLRLVEASSSHDYQTSEVKWSTAKKRREMLLPDMRYLVLKSTTSADQENVLPLAGFASFMFTYEDGYEVVYIYEIHLQPDFREQGLGKILLDLIEGAGKAIGVAKTMLTVFVTNKSAVQWYEKRGFAVDAFSPGPRTLRNGTVKEPSYRILSKVNNVPQPQSSP